MRKPRRHDELIDAAIAINRARRLKREDKKLQSKHFASAYVKTNDLKKAAAEVGVSPQVGRELLHVPEVRAEIEEGISEAARRAGVSRQWVIENLKSVAERCMQAQPVLDKLGNETGMYVFDASGANRSLELIGKHLRVFEDDTPAAQLGTAVMRLLAQEAQTARLGQTVTPHTSVPTTIDNSQERVPPAEGEKVLAPGSALGPVDQAFNTVTPEATTP
jgi:phage terminase small subunit